MAFIITTFLKWVIYTALFCKVWYFLPFTVHPSAPLILTKTLLECSLSAQGLFNVNISILVSTVLHHVSVMGKIILIHFFNDASLLATSS